MNIETMWDTLTEYGVSEHTLQIVTSINGYSTDTLEDVLFAHMGLTSFDQLEDEYGDEDDDEDEDEDTPLTIGDVYPVTLIA